MPATALGLGAVLGLCAVVRLALLNSSIARLEADEAVTGIMARRILAGEDLYIYFAGQRYMGALEQYLQAVSLALLPDTPFSLRLPEVLISVATCWFVYAAGVIILGSRNRALFAATLFALGPYYNLLFGVKAVGGLAVAALVGTAAIWLALRLDPAAPRARLVAGALGLCCGLGFWETWSSAFVLVPAVVWGLWAARGHLLRLLPAAAAGFALGALPVVAFVLKYRELPSPLGMSMPASSVWERAEVFGSAILPMFLGLELAGGSAVADWLPSQVLVLGLAAVFGAGVAASPLWKRREPRPVDLVLLIFLIAPLFWIASTYGYFGGEPRYLHPLGGALALGAAAVLPRTARAPLIVGAAILVAWVGLTALSVNRVSDLGGGGAIVSGTRIHTDCMPEVARTLEGAGARSVYGDYWAVYTLKFFADEELGVAPFIQTRFHDMAGRVNDDPAPAYVVPVGTPAAELDARLAAAGVDSRKQEVCSLAVYTDLSRRVRPRDLGL